MKNHQTFQILTVPTIKKRKLNVLPVKVQGESNLTVHADHPNVKNAKEQVFVKVKRAVRNRVYTGKTHLRGFQILDFSLVRAGGGQRCRRVSLHRRLRTRRDFVCVAVNYIRFIIHPHQVLNLLLSIPDEEQPQ